ncbi:MAG: hypothetical protein N2316_01660 [Spirochaetes bacterium]|nr:hypothetical protein [Spirochaetota bacterium]
MKNDSLEMYVETLLRAARIDVQRGVSKEHIISSLSRIVDKDIFIRFRERF